MLTWHSLLLLVLFLSMYPQQQQAEKSACHDNRLLSISERYGRSGNNLIQLSRALWLSVHLNRTFVIPYWLIRELRPFDLQPLIQTFCVIIEIDSSNSNRVREGKSADILTLRGEDIYFGHTLYLDPHKRYGNLSQHLPILSWPLMRRLAEHAHTVSSLLWTGANRYLRLAVSDIVLHDLGNRSDYMSIHLRSFEGQCFKMLHSATSLEHYRPQDRYLRNALCSMSSEALGRLNAAYATNVEHAVAKYTYVATDLNSRRLRHMIPTHEKQYVLGDSAYQSMLKRLRSQGIKEIEFRELSMPVYRIFVDMMLCIRSAVFVMNPASTFSWEVFVARVNN